MAETLHRLSGGRLLLGLGAGGNDVELAAVGARALSPGEKITALGEVVAILRRLWTEPEVTFDGRFHTTSDATLTPRPGSTIPIWLGTFGSRGLDLAGRVADGWIPTLGYVPEERLGPMRQQVLRAAEAAGRDPGAVRTILNVPIDVGGRPGGNPGQLTGEPVAVAERLWGFVEMGFDGFNFIAPEEDAPDQHRRLAGEILPLLRPVAVSAPAAGARSERPPV